MSIIVLNIGSVLAQASITEGMTPSIVNINGLNVWGEYTQSQVISLLGTPTTYTDEMVVDEDSISTRVQTYKYTEQTIFIFYNQRLVIFDIQTPFFSPNNAVKVGDSYMKIYNFLNAIGSSNFNFDISSVLGTYVDVFFPSGEHGSITFYYQVDILLGNPISRITFDTGFY